MEKGKDTNKKGKIAAAAAKANANSTKKKGSVRDYFKGVKVEMKKVVWPTKKELVSYTGVVLFTCFIFGLGIWAADSTFLLGLKTVWKITF